MLPDPLHPAVIHLPLALAVLAPLVAAALLFVIHRSSGAGRAWWAMVAVHAVLAASALGASETGEHEEERVEAVVAERHIEAHEEAAEVFIASAVVALAVAAAGLAPGRIGAAARVATLVAALVTAGLATRVGHSGGELVYRHGAAAAYVDGAPPAAEPEHEDDD